MSKICSIGHDSDVEVKTESGSHLIRVNKLCKWPVNCGKAAEALTALIAIREAGYKVPTDVIKEIAKKAVKKIFDQPSDML